jgi:hypothetical protein
LRLPRSTFGINTAPKPPELAVMRPGLNA